MEWNDEFELPGGFDLMSDIQDYIEYIIIKYETSPTNPTHIYINRTNNKLVFKIKKMDIRQNYKSWKPLDYLLAQKCFR